MPIHHPYTSHNRTKFIELDTRLCEACWKCIGACRQKVIGRINLPFHRHARIVNADKCTGCKKCVVDCQAGALRSINKAHS